MDTRTVRLSSITTLTMFRKMIMVGLRWMILMWKRLYGLSKSPSWMESSVAFATKPSRLPRLYTATSMKSSDARTFTATSTSIHFKQLESSSDISMCFTTISRSFDVLIATKDSHLLTSLIDTPTKSDVIVAHSMAVLRCLSLAKTRITTTTRENIAGFPTLYAHTAGEHSLPIQTATGISDKTQIVKKLELRRQTWGRVFRFRMSLDVEMFAFNICS
ncbi:hypothetical protein QBC40DRAFT_293872 [Triangularia verruculosa]|uniref:Uncharacterized protein n=1 Tax=Triangularia verruculosa TaxID=2587418 RepID=A0AAN6XPR2_9PEZI|nr:hypothetical protein QBC40DRAFT_293872 [Triangularia verruculosa]